MERIVLAYSGGLDTSVAIAWLAETYDAEVIAVTLDLGQGRELTDVRERALARRRRRARTCSTCARSSRATTSCRRCRPARSTRIAIRSPPRSAVRSSRASSSTWRAWKARRSIAHGCNGKANDELRLELGVRALDPVDDGPGAGAQLGHVASRGDRVRQGAADPDPVDHRQSLHGGHQPLGPLDRARRARGPVAGIARGHLRADALAADLSQRAGLHRGRVRARACRSGPTASRCRSSS